MLEARFVLSSVGNDRKPQTAMSTGDLTLFSYAYKESFSKSAISASLIVDSHSFVMC
jgi:hypothetical protein